MSDDHEDLEKVRAAEEAARIVAATAMDIDAVASRASRAVQRLERMDAEPNLVVAVRRALEALAGTAHALRRDGLIPRDQQQLL